MNDDSLVSVVTPVYNGERYLVECIESVLAQTYQNWEYIIVNNRSTDETLAVAERYASKDKRIRLVNNPHFVGVIENHNICFRNISPESKYCKVVPADDWLFPDCIEKMVNLAEKNPTVGIVGSHKLRRKDASLLGVPYNKTVFKGADVCRMYLLGVIECFGTPSAVLYRASLVRSKASFYPGSSPNADFAACFLSLKDSDFGFIHQLLSFQREHPQALSNGLMKMNSFLIDRMQFLEEFGPTYLTIDEIAATKNKLQRAYYDSLGVAVVNCRGNKAFWDYQRKRLKDIGYRISTFNLVRAVCMKSIDLLFNPKQTIEKLIVKCRLHGQEDATTN
jgi:glycosyltransferase involved in cell wall biosynthesis